LARQTVVCPHQINDDFAFWIDLSTVQRAVRVCEGAFRLGAIPGDHDRLTVFESHHNLDRYSQLTGALHSETVLVDPRQPVIDRVAAVHQSIEEPGHILAVYLRD